MKYLRIYFIIFSILLSSQSLYASQKEEKENKNQVSSFFSGLTETKTPRLFGYIGAIVTALKEDTRKASLFFTIGAELWQNWEGLFGIFRPCCKSKHQESAAAYPKLIMDNISKMNGLQVYVLQEFFNWLHYNKLTPVMDKS